MSSVQAVPVTNRLLSALPRKERELLLSHCEPVELVIAETLHRAGEPIPHVYFPTDRKNFDNFLSLNCELSSR